MENDLYKDFVPPPPYKSHKEFVERFDLIMFTYNKLLAYLEPERKGTPREEKRYFSKIKFSAVLRMLVLGGWLFPTLKSIALGLEINYSLLRRWAREAEFRRMVHQILKEYLDSYLDLLFQLLKELGATFRMERKSPDIREKEAMSIHYLSLLIDLADMSWGRLVIEEAHKRIKLFQKEKAKEIGSMSAFLNVLILILHVRSKRKLKIDADDLFRSHSEMEKIFHQIHWDISVAVDQNRPDSAKALSITQTRLLILLSNRLHEFAAGKNWKPKEKFDMWSGSMPINTPTSYMSQRG